MSTPRAADLAEAVEYALIDRGPLSMGELVDALRAAGFTFGESPEDDVFDELERYNSDDIAALLDGRLAYAPDLLDGRVFTHRLTRDEVERDVLAVYPDLVPALWWKDPVIKTSARVGQHDVATLPPGTLAELGAQQGDLIGLSITSTGYDLDRVQEHEVTAHSEKARRWWLEAVAGPEPQELETALLTACADVGAAFVKPHPPLAEFFADLGLVQKGEWVAPAGFDFQAHRARGRVDRLAEDHELSEEEALCVAGLWELHRRLTEVSDPADFALVASGGSADPGAPPLPVTPMANQLREPAVASAFLEETLGDEEDQGAETLARMVEILEENATRTARPALRWLRAKAYERLGRVAEAEDCLHEAERLDPDWPLTLLDLARYASDRGDATQGLALLARADPYVDDDLHDLLDRFLPRPGPVIGRNEPCWCGSGRKFKQCHLHKPVTPPLEERAAWLYRKAGQFVMDGPWRTLVYELSMERAAYAENEKAVRAAADDPLVGDVVLFEGGAMMQFVDERGFLLPEDELRLAEQWMFIGRSLFEITAVQRGEGFTARDLLTGDRHVVRDRTASRYVKPGLLICARIVPAGATMQVFGGIEPVPLADRDQLLALLDEGYEPEELVAFLTRRFAPRTLVNTDGDPLIFREVVLAVGDPAALSLGLDRAYRRLEDTEPAEWLHEQSVDGLERIYGRLRLTGAELRIETNGDRRMDDVLATVRELDPLARVVVDERQPVTNTHDAAQIAAKRQSTGSELIAPEDQPAEIQLALAEHMATYEQRWLDLTIPALNGLTPRQAAADPTRRDDLRQLLASFDDGSDSPMLMSASRLRSELGLDD